MNTMIKKDKDAIARDGRHFSLAFLTTLGFLLVLVTNGPAFAGKTTHKCAKYGGGWTAQPCSERTDCDATFQDVFCSRLQANGVTQESRNLLSGECKKRGVTRRYYAIESNQKKGVIQAFADCSDNDVELLIARKAFMNDANAVGGAGVVSIMHCMQVAGTPLSLLSTGQSKGFYNKVGFTGEGSMTLSMTPANFAKKNCASNSPSVFMQAVNWILRRN
mgnify:CR=1 FL=1